MARQKLNEQSAREVKRLLAEGVSTREISERFGIAEATAFNIKRGQIWGWLK
jgi:DNA-binding CsgD family transcriptional regulator